MIKVGIVGGTGYTGVELLRLLSVHSQVELKAITSRSNLGTKVSDIFSSLRGYADIEFSHPDDPNLAQCDLVFFATPSAIAMNQVPDLLKAGVKVIDLAADFRIKDIKVWEKWYGAKHTCPEIVEQAVYGLPEMNRKAIKSAQIVANPGCYPTAVTLGLLPLLKSNLIEEKDIIADCKSGVSGAGRKANVTTLLCESSESVKAYGVSGHRHLPEITQNLQQIRAQSKLVFVPHLMPMVRGIHATVYASVKDNSVDFIQHFKDFYQNEPFVDVLDEGQTPETRSVKGANYCRIGIQYLPDSNKVVVMSVIDNLVKGAAGQAVQNMNLMFGLNENEGLDNPGLML